MLAPATPPSQDTGSVGGGEWAQGCASSEASRQRGLRASRRAEVEGEVGPLLSVWGGQGCGGAVGHSLGRLVIASTGVGNEDCVRGTTLALGHGASMYRSVR